MVIPINQKSENGWTREELESVLQSRLRKAQDARASLWEAETAIKVIQQELETLPVRRRK